MLYPTGWINWCGVHLNPAFDAAMMRTLSVHKYGVLWDEGLHELYCMGREL